MKYLLPLASLAMLAAPVTAQDLANQEIVVTATRVTQSGTRDREDGPISAMPAVGLRQPADFLVQKVIIRGDTRDPEQRSREIRTMLGDAIRRADAAGVELAYGDYILTRLTPENAEDIALQRDNRPDSERVEFLVKARLGKTQSGEAAERQIARYLDSVPEAGRAQMDSWGDSTLSIVGPDSYRPQIADRIAEDANAMARRMGENYAVEVEGLNMPVQWARSGPGEVLLYIPYRLTIVPRP